MPPRLNLVGKRFVKLTVLSYVETRNGWKCKCDCGNEVITRGSRLSSGRVKSCGCYSKHGHAPTNNHSSTYISWVHIIGRCNNPKSDKYKNYGGRGIKVCDRWLNFVNFLEDMGIRPIGKSIDRINNDGNYEPGNCRWATRSEQELNKCRKAHVSNEVTNLRTLCLGTL